jgi:hypothetical protein
MDEQYHVQVTSRDSAEVDDIPLTPPQEDKLTRRIIRPSIVNNANEAAASVRLHLIHQKRHKKNEPWEDAEKFNIATLKAGEEVRFALDSTETWRLKETLNQLYAIGRNGVPHHSNDFVAVPTHQIADSLIVKGTAKEMVEKLNEQYGDEIWDALGEIQPNLIETIALKSLNDKRQETVQKFRKVLEGPPTKEHHWQKFFSENLWIFGHSLDYRILNIVQEQPHYGGTTMTGKGAQRGDFLMATKAGFGFTVIVDIKTPHASLVESELYRNGAHKIGSDVSGGVAQLQSYCHTWDKSGSKQEDNMEHLDKENICTYEPKSILIVGNTAQLNTKAKRSSFELFRRNLHNPEILTFDELLARAEWIVGIQADESVAP